MTEGTLDISGVFLNTGKLRVDDATLTIGATDPLFETSACSVDGTGRIRFPNAPAIANTGELAPGLGFAGVPPEGLTIEVPYLRNEPSASFIAEVGPTSAGRLVCTGIFDIGGTIELFADEGVVFTGNESFAVIEADFVTAVFGDYFTNAVPMSGNRAVAVRTNGIRYDVVYNPTSIVIENIGFDVPPCSPADITSEGSANNLPDGVVTLSDFSLYLTLWSTSDVAADLTTTGTANGIPDGGLDLSDFSFYLTIWSAGCP